MLCSIILQPAVTLDAAITFTFSKEGSHTVTVQALAGNIVHQDRIRVAVYGNYIYYLSLFKLKIFLKLHFLQDSEVNWAIIYLFIKDAL